jgi:putative ABC transport system permease protein
VWVGSPQVLSVDLGRPIPMSFMSRIAQDSRVEEVESYYQAFGSWTKPDGGSDLCIVVGCNLNDGNLGAVSELTPEMRVLLTQPGAIVVDQGELERLGVAGVGDKAEINKRTVQIVGLVKGLTSLAGPYVFCSRETARSLLRSVMPPDHTTYFLVKCKNEQDAPALVEDLKKQYHVSSGQRWRVGPAPTVDENTKKLEPEDMSVFTKAGFSFHSEYHWLRKTKAGIALGYAALLGLLVGMVVTSQTLYAATRASDREYAILLALGIPRWRVSLTVLIQSFWVGIIGIILAYPVVRMLAELVALGGVKVMLEWWLLAGAAVVTMFMAMVSGALALRSVRQIEPMSLLR